MATIGKVVISLEAQHAAFQQGMERSVKALEQLAQKAQETKQSTDGFLAGLTAGATAAVVTGGLSLIADAFHAITGSIEGAITTVTQWVEHSIEAASAAYHLSNALGIATDSLQGLQYAARLSGVSQETFNGALEKFQVNIAEAVNGAGSARSAFNELGISSQQLREDTLDQTFARTADALKNLSDATRRAALEKELFGKSGQALNAVFLEGSQGIPQYIEQARKVGFALSNVDAAKLQQAGDAVEAVKLSFEGVQNTLAVELAPYISVVADKIREMIPPASEWHTIFHTGIVAVAKAVAYLWDLWDNSLKPAVLNAALVGVNALDYFLTAIDKVVSAVDSLNIKWVGLAKNVGATLVVLAPGMAAAAGLAGRLTTTGPAPAAKNSFIANSQVELDKARKALQASIAASGGASHSGQVLNTVKALEDGLTASAEKAAAQRSDAISETERHRSAAAEKAKKDLEAEQKIHEEITGQLVKMAQEYNEITMTAGERAEYEALIRGATADEAAAVRHIAEQTEALKEQMKVREQIWQLTGKITVGAITPDFAEKLKDQAAALKLATQTPFEQFQAEANRINTLLSQGLIDKETAGRAFGKAGQSLLGAQGGPLARPEAASRRFTFDVPKDPQLADPLTQLAAVARAQAADVSQSKYYLSEMYRFLGNQDKNTFSPAGFK